MSFGQALGDALEKQDKGYKHAAHAGAVTDSLVGKIIKGQRRPSKDTMRLIAQSMDSPELMLAAQEEVTGGASVPWLNAADHHRAMEHIRAAQEITEAIQHMQATAITKDREQMTPEELKQVGQTIKECIEAITALTHYVAALCRDYTFSWLGCWKTHRQEMVTRKLLK